MKYLLHFFLFLISSLASAHVNTDATAKAQLKIIYLAYESWNASTTGYIEPQAYITDAKTNLIKGQNFISFTGAEKFITVNLDADSTSAVLHDASKNYDVTLTWDSVRITGVKIDGLSRCDYTVEYDKTGKLISLTAKEIVNKAFRYVHAVEFSGEQLTKITRFENPLEGKKTWIRCIKTFDRKDNEVITKCVTYKSNLPNKPENIFSTTQQSFKKINDNSYATMLPYGETIETTYNDDNMIATRRVNNKGKIELTTYTYKDKKLFKEDVMKTQGSVFIEHTITNYFSLTDQASFVEDYEKTRGTYKLDEKRNVILEARDNKYRVKKDGVWSPWMDVKK